MEEALQATTELSQPSAIRVETAISRYPVHRLAKRGDIAIDIREESEDGGTLTRWEVSHNSKYGQPGPLAYKVDTLIVNRRIEEAPRPIPKLIKLGSLRDICRELGLNEGQATRGIKNALYQNSFSGITAKTRYRQSDGTEKTLEAGFTRYSVVFTGEKLPDGRKADAVYLILNEIFMQVLNGAMTRPLDYDYLRSLPPAPQRFYELLSYQMYAALKNDRPRAKLTYSHYCTYAPQMRYFDWEQARKQMAKIHRPHKEAGYIAKVEFQQTADSHGQPDWIMLYTPGLKARAEFRAFAKRGGPTMIEVEPLPIESEVSDSGPSQLLLAFESPLVTELTKREVTEVVAIDLVQQFPAELVEAKVEIFDWLLETQDKRAAKSPAGYLVKSIADNYATPKGFVTRAERQAREEAKQARERQAAEQRHQQQAQEAHARDTKRRIDAYLKQLDPAERSALEARVLAAASPKDRENYERQVMAQFRDTYMLMMLREYLAGKPELLQITVEA